MNNNKKQELIEVYRDTVDYCNKKHFETQPSIYHLYREHELQPIAKFGGTGTQIRIENMDTLDMAMMLGGENCLVMNMACDTYPGGGVRKGSMAQEEELFRRTNYYKVLNRKFYPITNEAVIYSPLVYIVKNRKYEIIKEFPISCIAVAAPRKPQVFNGTYAEIEDLLSMQTKIDLVFRTAIYYKKTRIVLGALGCGAYGNPPDVVASIFVDRVKLYRDFFEFIGFAILLVKDSDKANLDAFNKEFNNNN